MSRKSCVIDNSPGFNGLICLDGDAYSGARVLAGFALAIAAGLTIPLRGSLTRQQLATGNRCVRKKPIHII
ncbi:MAG: hypothetical protein U1F46_11350 [Marinagarivorans sp.]